MFARNRHSRQNRSIQAEYPIEAWPLAIDYEAVKRPGLAALLLMLAIVVECPAVAQQAQGDKEAIDVQELVRQAVINFNTRESLPRDYTYVEDRMVDFPDRKNGHRTDSFEVVEIKGQAFRRQITHNGKQLAVPGDPEKEEADHEKWQRVEHKILEEQIKPGYSKESLAAAVQKIVEDAGLKDWQSQLFMPTPVPSMDVVTFKQELSQFKLPLQDLALKFHLKSKGKEVLNGRWMYVVQADPVHHKGYTDPAGNFKIKVWIDQQDKQIAKIEGRAIDTGPLAHADYTAVSSKSLSKKEIEERKQQLAESQLFYSDYTVIMQEWSKVNNEVWLQSRRHVKGAYVLVMDAQVRYSPLNLQVPAEYDTVDTNYKKFRVEHRILPVGVTQ